MATALVSALVGDCISGCTNGQGGANASAVKPQPGVVYFLNDQLGTSHVVTDSLGKVVHEENAYPYGERRESSGGASTAKPHYSFTGKEYDEETGLVYFGGRYYSPALGRWITPDPLFVEKQPAKLTTSPLQLNLYSYVKNNPTTLVDEYGFEFAFPEGVSAEHVASFNGAAPYLHAVGLGKVYDYLKDHKATIWIHETKDHDMRFDASDPHNLKLYWNSASGLDVSKWPAGVAFTANSEGSSVQTPYMGLAHEMCHAEGYLKGTMLSQEIVPGNPYGSPEEERVIKGLETPAAIMGDEPVRYGYHGSAVKVLNAASRTRVHRP